MMTRKYRYFFFLITILWTAFIFSMSLKPAAESSELSGGIVAWLTSAIFAPIFENISDLEHYVRKLAHFTEFGILGGLATAASRNLYGLQKRYTAYLFPIVYGILIAATDETIQLFVPGRSGQVSDVLLDSTGALCGVVVLNFLLKSLKGGILRGDKRQ